MVVCVILATSNHFASFHFAFDNKQLASIGHPNSGARPFSQSVIDSETLTFVSIRAFVVLPQDAATEYEINSGARDLGRAANIKRVPITDPKLKLPVCRRSTGSGCGRSAEETRPAAMSTFARKRTRTMQAISTFSDRAIGFILIFSIFLNADKNRY